MLIWGSATGGCRNDGVVAFSGNARERPMAVTNRLPMNDDGLSTVYRHATQIGIINQFVIFPYFIRESLYIANIH